MTPTQNKQLMQDIFAGLAEGDRRLFVEHLSEEVSLEITGQYSWSQTIRGKERCLALYAYVQSRMSRRNKTRAFRFLADEDWVVVEARGDMLTKEGNAYNNHYCLLYRLTDGKIVEMKEYQDSTLGERVLGPFPAQLRPELAA